MGVFIWFFFYLLPLGFLLIAVPKEAKNPAGDNVLRLIQIFSYCKRVYENRPALSSQARPSFCVGLARTPLVKTA